MREEQNPTSLLQIWGQFMMLPVAAFVQGMELLLQTVKAMQPASDGGVKGVIGITTLSNGPPNLPAIYGGDQPSAGDAGGKGRDDSPDTNDSTKKAQEERMLDTNLQDDSLKLVRYKILFVKRGYEYAFPEQEDLVVDNMDGAAFTAWKIAEFIQNLGMMNTKVPDKWHDYPKQVYVSDDNHLKGFDPDDKKYLRVYFEVLQRYTREKFKFEEDQIQVLKEIRDKI